MSRLRLLRFAGVAVALVAVAVFLPIAFGGDTAYVRAYGTSIDPTFHAGDLAIVRRAGSYDVGDVVAYRSPDLDRVVLHRVVERDGDILGFQGDNNDYVDPERLGHDDVVGRLVLRVPHGGDVLSWLADPLHAVALAVALSALPAVLVARRRRRPGHRRAATRAPLPASRARALRVASVWVAAGGVCLAGVGLAALARPAERRVDDEIGFTQRAEFSYSAAPSVELAGPMYPAGIGTGDPVFRRLADDVTVHVTHAVDSDADVAVDGTLSVDAVLTGDTGWERTLPLVADRPLRDGETTATVALDLARLDELAAEAAVITGTPEAGVHVAVEATFDIDGTVGGRPVSDRFAPVLAFVLDDVALRLAPAGQGGDLVQTSDGAVVVPGFERSVLALPVPGPDPTVDVARVAGLVGGGAALLLAAALFVAGRPRDRSEAARIEARYGHLLLSVRAPEHDVDAVDVTSMADLARVAEHHERLVLHHSSGDRHTYLVEVDTTTYRFSVPRTMAAVTEIGPPPPPRGPRHQAPAGRPRQARPPRVPRPAAPRTRRAPAAEPAVLPKAVGASPLYMR